MEPIMKPKVYFNEKCSICRIEINHYKKNCDSIEWLDINTNNDYINDNQENKNQLLRRIHLKHKGKTLIGLDAFIFIWSKIQRYKFLSKLLKLPIIYQLAFIGYEILAFLLFIKNYKQFDK